MRIQSTFLSSRVIIHVRPTTCCCSTRSSNIFPTVLTVDVVVWGGCWKHTWRFALLSNNVSVCVCVFVFRNMRKWSPPCWWGKSFLAFFTTVLRMGTWNMWECGDFSKEQKTTRTSKSTQRETRFSFAPRPGCISISTPLRLPYRYLRGCFMGALLGVFCDTPYFSLAHWHHRPSHSGESLNWATFGSSFAQLGFPRVSTLWSNLTYVFPTSRQKGMNNLQTFKHFF